MTSKEEFYKWYHKSELHSLISAWQAACAWQKEQDARICESDIERYSNTVLTNGGHWKGKRDWNECAQAIREQGEEA